MTASRILIVRGTKVISEGLTERLTESAHEVFTVVASGEEAIQKAEETLPDMLLMDLVLSGRMDGAEDDSHYLDTKGLERENQDAANQA